jgi:hypothetical protein
MLSQALRAVYKNRPRCFCTSTDDGGGPDTGDGPPRNLIVALAPFAASRRDHDEKQRHEDAEHGRRDYAAHDADCVLRMQVAFRMTGNDASGAEGDLDLNVWESVIRESLSATMRLMQRAISLFVSSCVRGLTVNSAGGYRNASFSLALSTPLVRIFGYSAASRVAKHASSNSISISKAAVECGLLDERGAEINSKSLAPSAIPNSL